MVLPKGQQDIDAFSLLVRLVALGFYKTPVQKSQ